MQNLTKRAIVWVVGIAALAALTLVVDFANHLALNVVAVVVSALGAGELSRLFERKDSHYRTRVLMIPLLGGLLPAVQILILNGVVPQEAFVISLYAAVAVTLLVQVFRRDPEELRDALTNAAATVTTILYPGLFLAYFVRLSEFTNAGPLIMLFLCTVFANDTLAYLAGGLYRGIRTRRSGDEWKPKVILAVSPNKTIVGFIVGLAGAPATILIAMSLFPDLFPGRPIHALGVGTAVGVATILGDLIESALKRSATSKDSGTMIPGRGGILDSADSVLYAAPVFYYLLTYLL